MKMTVFWKVAPCSLVDVYRRFRCAYSLLVKGVSTSETSVNFYQTTRGNIPEDSHLQFLDYMRGELPVQQVIVPAYLL
jgi:hypothetical protein